MRQNAQILVISTDDAWFGKTSGPYMHAQIAQLRAIESGAYVVRAAATGISGIIAPDGNWQARTRLEERATVERASRSAGTDALLAASDPPPSSSHWRSSIWRYFWLPGLRERDNPSGGSHR